MDIAVLAQPELSREYRVRPDGSVSLHYVGSVPAAGLLPSELEATLEARFSQVFEGTVSATVEVARYRPVVVVGDVQTPGAYGFAPGMDVLGAIALAGGPPRFSASGDTTASMRVATETASFQLARVRLASLLIERARLVAERDGIATFTAPDEATQILGAEQAKAIADVQAELMRVRAEQLKLRVESQQGQLDLAGKEAEAFAGRRVLLQKQIDAIQEQLDSQVKLAERGLALSQQVLNLRLSADTNRADELEAVAFEAEANQKAASAEAGKLSAVSLQHGEIISRIADIDAQIEELRAQIESSRQFVRLFGGADPLVAAIGAAPTYVLRRRDAQGVTVVAAGPETLLQPGDTVEVVPAPVAPAPGGAAPAPVADSATAAPEAGSTTPAPASDSAAPEAPSPTATPAP